MSDRQEWNTKVKLLAALARGESDELRVSLDTADMDGKIVSWVSVRIWFRAANGKMCPTKKGVTIRMREIGTLQKALSEAVKQQESGDAG